MEDKKDNKLIQDEETAGEQEKQNCYLSAAYSALANNCMEIDKQLLYLSSAGIGLLITFSFSRINNLTQFFLWLFSIILFLITIIICLYIFEVNNDMLKSSIEDKPVDTKLADFLDRISKVFFILAILLTFILSLTMFNYKMYFCNENCKQKKEEIVRETVLCENNEVKCLQYTDANLKEMNGNK